MKLQICALESLGVYTTDTGIEYLIRVFVSIAMGYQPCAIACPFHQIHLGDKHINITNGKGMFTAFYYSLFHQYWLT